MGPFILLPEASYPELIYTNRQTISEEKTNWTKVKAITSTSTGDILRLKSTDLLLGSARYRTSDCNDSWPSVHARHLADQISPRRRVMAGCGT